MAAADEAASRVVAVELEARRADIAAAGPGIDRIVEHADRGAVFVEGDVAPRQVAAVGEAIRKPAGLRQQQQPRRFHGAAGQQEDIRLLLEQVALGILVEGAFHPARAVQVSSRTMQSGRRS